MKYPVVMASPLGVRPTDARMLLKQNFCAVELFLTIATANRVKVTANVLIGDALSH